MSYLLDRAFITRESIVAGDLAITDVSRRNRNFKIVSEQGPSYLVKQGIGSEGVATVAHEAVIYRLLHSDSSRNGMCRYLPAFHAYDEKQHLLILELLRNTEDLRQHHLRRGRFSKSLAVSQGEALGSLHRQIWSEKSAETAVFRHEPPWVLSIHRPELGALREISSANIQLIRIIQKFVAFTDILDKMRSEWRNEALIHFDIKWDNLMVSRRSREQRSGLKIIDWEVAGIGDPCWDVGTVFCGYLSFWLLSIPIVGKSSLDESLQLARYPLSRMQPAIRAFWEAYVRRMNFRSDIAAQVLVRSLRYCAVRLIQTAYEQMQMANQLNGNIICFLQLSLNMLRRQQEATVLLLGIPMPAVDG